PAGQLLRVRGASGAARDEGREPPGKVRVQQKRAYALRAEQALVSRHDQCGEAKALKIHLDMPRRLRGVEREGDAALAADLANRLRSLYPAPDFGAVAHHYEAGVALYHAGQGFEAQAALRVAGDALKGDALALQLHQGAHDGVVLHRGHEAVVARAEQAL